MEMMKKYINKTCDKRYRELSLKYKKFKSELSSLLNFLLHIFNKYYEDILLECFFCSINCIFP